MIVAADFAGAQQNALPDCLAPAAAEPVNREAVAAAAAGPIVKQGGAADGSQEMPQADCQELANDYVDLLEVDWHCAASDAVVAVKVLDAPCLVQAATFQQAGLWWGMPYMAAAVSAAAPTWTTDSLSESWLQNPLREMRQMQAYSAEPLSSDRR